MGVILIWAVLCILLSFSQKKPSWQKSVFCHPCITCSCSWPTLAMKIFINKNFETEFGGSMNWSQIIYENETRGWVNLSTNAEYFSKHNFSSSVNEFYWLKQWGFISYSIFFCKSNLQFHKDVKTGISHPSCQKRKSILSVFWNIYSLPTFVSAEALRKLGTKAKQVKLM